MTAGVAVPPTAEGMPIIAGRGLVKVFGGVVALDGADIELYRGEVLAVIGDNGAGKSTLIKILAGAIVPDLGELRVEGEPIELRRPQDARAAGIETVHQSLAVAPALDVASNIFLGRELRRQSRLGKTLGLLDHQAMRTQAREHLESLGIRTIQNMGQAVETLSGGQRQAVAVARAAAFGSRVIILDEPTAALGVKEANLVLDLIRDLRSRGLAVILVSHNMPQVFEVADRIHIQRLGRRVAVVTPETHTMSDAVAIMTGAVLSPAPAAQLDDGNRRRWVDA